jgi:hypothetical protein
MSVHQSQGFTARTLKWHLKLETPEIERVSSQIEKKKKKREKNRSERNNI